MRKFILLQSSILLMATTVWASIPENKPALEKILAKKEVEKFAELKRLGPDVYSDLRKIAFNETRVLGIRWQAFMAMARIGEREALPEINEALKSRDWFLRDAAIQVLPVLDKEKAYAAALRGLNDSALVVRTTAVDTLGHLKKTDCASQLWSQLYSKNNYMRHQSLWIRRHIVEALAELAPPGSEEKFVKVLDDNDSTLFGPAIRGLERLTGQSLGDPRTPPVYRRYFWKRWYQDQSTKKKS